jgi:hypothetical protein
MAKDLRIEKTPEGFIAYCHGSSSPFSFLAGQAELSGTKIGDNYLFETRSLHGPYAVEFIWPDLAKSVAELSSEHDLEILADYCHWEMDYQEQTHHSRLVPQSVVATKLPTGRIFIAWYSKPAVDVAAPVTDPEEVSSNENSSEGLQVTPYSGYAVIRNDHELLVFKTQGLSGNWTPESLRLKAIRITFSTFFE